MTRADFYRRSDELAAEIQLAMDGGTLIFENGWLVEVVQEHTCGTGKDGYYGMHEPSCGRIPIFNVAAAMIRDQDTLRASDEASERWGWGDGGMRA